MTRPSNRTLPLITLFAMAAAHLLAPNPVHAQNTHVSPVPKEPCCMNNFRYSGTCEVTPRQGQYCENILSYLNNIDSSGETYCLSTYIRGGWSLIDCDSGTPSGQIGYATPQTIKTQDPSTMNAVPPSSDNRVQPGASVNASQPEELKVTQANVIQVRLEQPVDGNHLTAGQELTGRLEADVYGPDGEVVAPAGSTISATVGAESAWDTAPTTGQAQLQLVGTTTSAADLFGTVGTTSAEAKTDPASIHLTGDLVQLSEDSVVTFQVKDISGQPADMRVLTTATTVWMEAFNRSDAVTIAGLSSEDGALLPPNGRAIIGREAIFSYWKDLLTDSDTTVELVNVETVVEGDLGYKAGRFALLDSTGAAIDQGKYIQIWRRSSQGYWELHRDMWNSSLSAVKTGS